MTTDSWNRAFNKVNAFSRSKVKYGDGPEVDAIVYAQGILRKRVGNKWFKCLDELKEMLDAGWSTEQIQDKARTVETIDDFQQWYRDWIGVVDGGKA